jgi:hypothetical protein
MIIKTVTQSYFFGDKAGLVVTYEDTNSTKVVPIDEENTDYQEILEWVAAGNTITDPGE